MMDATRVTGPAKQLLAVTPGLLAAGIESEFLVCIRRGIASTPFWEAVRSSGAPVHGIEDRFPGDPGLLRQFKEVIARVGPDLLQTHGYRPNVLARLSRGSRGCPWLGFWHGATWENWRVRLYNHVDYWALSKADRVVTVSRQQAETLGSLLPRGRPVNVIPNAVTLAPRAVDAKERALWRAPHVRDERTRLLGVFGRFSSEKGQDVFLNAMSQLDDDNVSALLLGEGPEESRLRQQSDALQLDGRVHFLGYREEVAKYYAMIDLLVLPSRSEGLPNVVLEAMACRVPVVATDVGGVREVVQHEGNGLLVPSERPDLLASAITRMLEDSALRQRLARNGERFVAEHYSLAARVAALRSLYDQVLDAKVNSRGSGKPGGELLLDSAE